MYLVWLDMYLIMSDVVLVLVPHASSEGRIYHMAKGRADDEETDQGLVVEKPRGPALRIPLS